MSERPIKVVQLISRLNIGGTAPHVCLLTAGLQPPEFDSRLVVGRISAHDGDMSYVAAEYGVEPLVVPEMALDNSPLMDLLSLFRLYRLLVAERPDIVHTHTAKSGFIGRLAARLARVPIVVHTFHGHELRGYGNRWVSLLLRLLERWCAGFSTLLLPISRRIRADLIDLGVAPPEKLHVCELGLKLGHFVATPRYGGVLRGQLGLARGVPLIGTCGRLVPIKNQMLLLAAAAQVHSQRPDAHFVVIGDGVLRTALEAETDRLGLGSVVHFLGWQQDPAPLVADLDLFVLTSLNEGTPVGIIEAAAEGVPVVSTRVGGVEDIVPDGRMSWLVESGDCAGLSRAILAALADPREADRRAQRARRAVVRRFDSDRLVDDIQTLYRRLVAHQRRGR